MVSYPAQLSTFHTLCMSLARLVLWQVLLSLPSPYAHLHILTFSFSLPLLRPDLSLWQVSLGLLCSYCTSQPFSFLHTHQDPACHCGRSRLIFLKARYPPPQLSPVLPPTQVRLVIVEVPPLSLPYKFLQLSILPRLVFPPPVSPFATPRAPAAMSK